jgi:hypothetical protein
VNGLSKRTKKSSGNYVLFMGMTGTDIERTVKMDKKIF